MEEVINYYGLLSRPVYASYTDASKVFDHVNHWHLFNKLLDRNVPKYIVRLLMIWYINGTCMNHLHYADDAVLLAPTVGGLEK